MLERKGIYSIEDVRQKVMPFNTGEKGTVIIDFDGDPLKANSQRYRLFFTKGFCCVKCGIEGKYFAKERDTNSNSDKYHLNLYAIDENGEEVLMTKDHIIPRSKGGNNKIDNYQTMCTRCNNKKGNILEETITS